MQPYHITLFTKDGCTLCVKAKTILDRLSLFYPLTVEEFDITTDEAVHAKYWDKIPVLHIDGAEAFVSKISEHWLRRYFEEHKAGKM
jgi:glutaredoxin